MKHFSHLLAIIAVTLMIASCNNKKDATGDLANNPLLNPAETYLNTPDFNSIKVEHYKPAFYEAMRIHSAEIEAIANNSEAPTFENTIVAMEKSGVALNRVSAIFFALTSADTNDELMAIESEITPKLSAHYDSISMNDALFQRIKTIYDGDQSAIDPEGRRVLKLTYEGFVRSGALLNDADKAKLKELNQKESTLMTDFGNRLTAATNAPIFITNKEQLKGLDESTLAAAATAAKEAGKEGQWLFHLNNTTGQDILASLENADTRKLFFDKSIGRCVQGDANDTRDIVKQLVKVRAEKAQILGFDNFAAWKLTDQLAAKPENAISMLTQLATLVKDKLAKEDAEIEAFAQKSMGADYKLTAWDRPYFAEQLRKEKYGVDEATLSQYFELDNVINNGIFFAANQMYGLTFEPRTDIPVYHPDVRCWDVKDANGEVIALFMLDPYARPSKSGGAWMSNFVEQSFLLGNKPVIYNVCNVRKPSAGEKCLLTWDETTTFFHEFGHALHGIFANQTYPSVSGTNVPRDFVETASQFNEHAALDPTVFAHYALHYQTGEVMPKELQEKMLRALSFNQAMPLAENVAACLIDMSWHTLSAADADIADVEAFEAEALKKYGVDFATVPPRYKSTYFRHIWSNGYSAGYYAYLWTEALESDIYEWMKQHGGLTAENGNRFRDLILSRGNSEDLMGLFSQFTGHDQMDVTSLLKARGLK